MTSYFVRQSDADGDGAGYNYVLDTRSTLYTGEKDFRKQIGAPTTLEADLLRLASAVFAADRATKRGEREEFGRDIVLSIPVVNTFRLMPLVPLVEQILRTLANDFWEIQLRQSQGNPETQVFDTSQEGRTLLFSGGLDSFAAAHMYAAEGKLHQLVSHVTRNAKTKKAQQTLVEALQNRFGPVSHYQFFASSRPGDQDAVAEHAVEGSQRTRSFLFMTLGALAARRAGNHRLVVLAENGQMAIHLPLTNARIGAFSTHTAHPDVLAPMRDYLALALGFEMVIENPFLHHTKAEVVREVVAQMPGAIEITESCWKNARGGAGGAHHCGECVPCYVRRIAIEYHGDDPTRYGRDLWAADFARLGPEDIGRRNLSDLVEFVRTIELSSDADIMELWPELYSEHIDAPRTITMYRRFAEEARVVLGQRPTVAALLA